ncbi:hypothetical protein CVT25_014164 [Psilocybe cyanescens]|uniref:HAT C-terminal dimerisation domain-containing protein n=1 Tax=Psilocybe cyanescens TaxID=93625 RepID=A0A409XUV3_PSICY|nr:hypothetical protein CVT25_014164 [Psilocybe cyanescens]
MLSHLKNCLHNDVNIRNNAVNEHALWTASKCHPAGVEATPRANRTYSAAGSATIIVSPRPVPYYNSSAPITGSTSGRAISYHLQQPTPDYFAGPAMHPPLDSSPPLIGGMMGGGDYHYAPSWASSYNHGYSPRTSRIDSPSTESYYSNHSLKHSRTSFGKSQSITCQSSMANINQTTQWNTDCQRKFEEAIGHLTASAGFALNWVANPEFIKLCKDFILGTKVPSWKVLTQRIIPSLLVKVCATVYSKVVGQNITLQCDGWSGINNHHFVAFIVTTYTELLTVRVNDTTTNRKTAEHLLVQMEEVIVYTQVEWKAFPIAFTTDVSGESRKAHHLSTHRWLCLTAMLIKYVNLIVGDYFKASDTDFLNDAARANEVISWLCSKTTLLWLICEEMASCKLRPLSVICPVPTHWTAFYLAYTRLLKLQRPIDNVIEDDACKPVQDQQVIQPAHGRSTHEKAVKMVEILKDQSFWVSLVHITHHLAPLAIATNVTQSAHCHMDEVLLTFGKLAVEFLKLTDPLEAPVQQALMESLEHQWSKSDQDVFIAAIILNPFHRLKPFRHEQSVISLGAKPYDNLESLCNGVEKEAAGADPKQSPDPMRIYDDMSVQDEEMTPITKLSLHILAICPNSASCERLFSSFGLILTKICNWLKKTTLLDLAELKMHLRDEYLCDNVKNMVQEQHFGTVQPQAESTQQTQAAATDSGNTCLTEILTSLAAAKAMLSEDEEVSTNEYWSGVDQRSAVASLESEMSFYELLDLDAAGEPDLDPDLDNAVASLFDM